jgi:plastocyanin
MIEGTRIMMVNGSSSIRRAMVVVAVLGMLAVSCSKQASARTAGSVTVREGPGNGYTFAPSTVTVNRGQLITLDNVSNVPHTFTVTGHGIHVETQPGKTSQITIELPSGTYPFICRFHVSLGMKGTLVVR